MPPRLEHEYVFNYYAKENYIMHNIYDGMSKKDKLTCPMGHEIEIKFNKFQQGRRCINCSGVKKHSQEYIFNYYKEHDYILNSIYNGITKKDQLTCPVGHQITMKFASFRHGYRCFKCYGHEKHSHEYISNYYKEHDYIMNNIYENSKTKDLLTCPVGHQIEISFNSFQAGRRCGKCSGLEKHSQEFISNYYKKHNYTLNSIYINSQSKDQLTCPVGHEIQMKFASFRHGYRCLTCSGSEKLTHEYISNYYKEHDYILNSIYENCKTKDQLTCPNGHEIEIRFNDFQQGRRCRHCFYDNNTGKNHYNFNPNREEIPLNKRLRKVFTKDWRIKYMKDDPNYNNFISNPDDYTVDHIIPVKLFCELTVKYNLNEYKIKNIINHIDNLQLLTWLENSKKRDKGSSLFEATNYLINNGIKFENFQTVAV